MRYGHIMENFGDYLRAGVNMGLGTDTTPHNMLEEMRNAAILARVAARDINTVSTADMLHAATIGGANAVLRQDIGRLAPGAKADIVVVDLECVEMAPVRDPLRSLVYHAAERAVRNVQHHGRPGGGRLADQEGSQNASDALPREPMPCPSRPLHAEGRHDTSRATNARRIASYLQAYKDFLAAARDCGHTFPRSPLLRDVAAGTMRFGGSARLGETHIARRHDLSNLPG